MATSDSDLATLHIRCGSDLRPVLARAGFAGDFLEYSNPLCQGPVLPGDDWLETRAAFIAHEYAPQANVLLGLRQAEAALHEAASHYARVVMWFEHDSYDQLILARCLDVFADSPPRVLELISVADYPVAPRFKRFIGLGQLLPDDLPAVWAQRRPVTEGALRAGRAVWRALRSPDPSELAAIARAGIADPPHLAMAVQRHCQELPWVGDGLSLTERLILTLLAEGHKTIGMIFRNLMEEREPLPWLGDIMLRSIIDSMKKTAAPVFDSVAPHDGEPWWRERLAITDLGREVLAGRVDYLSLRPPERWVGGVAVVPGTAGWRWDGMAARPVSRLHPGP